MLFRPAFDPEDARIEPILGERMRAEVVLEHLEPALNSALKAVDIANDRALQALECLHDPVYQALIVEEIKREFADNPGFSDEVAKLMLESGDRRG